MAEVCDKGMVTLTLMFFALTTVYATALKRSIEETTQCTYTFNVPSADGNTCPPGATSETIGNLQSLLSNQYSTLEQLLGGIVSRLDTLTNHTSGNNQGTGGSAVTGSGTNYVRWGRTTCPETSVIIYEGHMGKAHFAHGGGSNYLCLPVDPEFPDGVLAGHQSQSYVYGVEYAQHSSPLIQPSIYNHDAPCAVCEAQGRNQVLVIPAKLSCPEGWIEEYEGLLMSQHHTQKPSEYVCVSNGRETVDSGHSNEYGGLLFVVEAVCGSLPCPPFVNGYEIGCVVCTK